MVFSKYGPIVKRLREVANTRPVLPAPRKRSASIATAQQLNESYTRSGLYRAERRIYRSMPNPWIFTELEEMQLYVNAVLSRCTTQYARASWPCTVRRGDEGTASYQAGVILVPSAIRQLTLLHEMAHHLAGPQHPHDAEFMEAYLYITRMEMGDTVTEKLKVLT